jgi:ribonuclease BN (tRNA processing enzyme)
LPHIGGKRTNSCGYLLFVALLKRKLASCWWQSYRLPFQKRLPKHFTTDEAILCAQKLKTKNLILTQIGHTYPPYRVAEYELREYLKTHDIHAPRVLMAFDGLRLRF